MSSTPPAVTTATGDAGPARRVGWLVAAIRGYQLARTGRPSGCRFIPSCSEYAVEALTAHGTVRGGGLAVRRLLRCHPWGAHGVDPVPGGPVPGGSGPGGPPTEALELGEAEPHALGEEVPCSR